MDSENSPGVYVDLQANPERYTGYSGHSANRVWSFIYDASCYSPSEAQIDVLEYNEKWETCSERKTFYRIISGLHASISTHIAIQYYNHKTGFWDDNFELFDERVGKHPERLNNMFVLYVLLYRAVTIIKPILLGMNYNCGPGSSTDEIAV